MSCQNCGKKSFSKSIKDIVSGAINWTFESQEIEDLALPRLAKCATCPMQRILVEVGSRKVTQCTKCMCLNELKARVVDEVCPLGFW